jgi:hypothetical protein
MLHAKLLARRYFSAWTDPKLISSLFDDVTTVWNPELGFEVGCWIRAGQIHRWFVENVQGRVDNDAKYPVATVQFYNLRAACQQVLSNRHLATKVLPPMDDGRVDDVYYQQLADTIVMIDTCLSMPSTWEFYYCSRY